MLDARDVEPIVAGEHVQHYRRVHDAPRYWAAMVERQRQRDDAADRDETISRLQSDDTAIGRRRANGAAGVGAERAVAQIGRNRSGRSAGRATRVSLERPGIPYRPVVARRRCASERELVQVRLAND